MRRSGRWSSRPTGSTEAQRSSSRRSRCPTVRVRPRRRWRRGRGRRAWRTWRRGWSAEVGAEKCGVVRWGSTVRRACFYLRMRGASGTQRRHQRARPALNGMHSGPTRCVIGKSSPCMSAPPSVQRHGADVLTKDLGKAVEPARKHRTLKTSRTRQRCRPHVAPQCTRNWPVVTVHRGKPWVPQLKLPRSRRAAVLNEMLQVEVHPGAINRMTGFVDSEQDAATQCRAQTVQSGYVPRFTTECENGRF
jgi:hypothetical protein